MAKRGGFPGGMGMPGNMNNLMKQAQMVQTVQMEKMERTDVKTSIKKIDYDVAETDGRESESAGRERIYGSSRRRSRRSDRKR